MAGKPLYYCDFSLGWCPDPCPPPPPPVDPPMKLTPYADNYGSWLAGSADWLEGCPSGQLNVTQVEYNMDRC